MLGNVDAVHALYYITVFPWVHIFGTSELALRFPSAVALTAASFIGVLLAYRLAHSTFKTDQQVYRATALSALLLAVQPSISMYGQEARGYAFGILMTLLATHMYLNFLDARKFALPLFVLFLTLAAGYSLYTIFLLPVFFLYALIQRVPWNRLFSLVLSGCAVMLLITPLLLLGRSQQEQVNWINNTLEVLLHRMYAQFFFSPASHFGHWGLIGKAWAPYIATGAVLLSLWGLIGTRFNKTFLFLIAAVLLPMSCIIAAQVLGFQLYTERYFAYLAPFVAIILGFALTSISFKIIRYILALLLVGSFVPASLGQSDFNAKVDHQYRTAGNFLATQQFDQVIFAHTIDRSLFTAAPPTHPYQDISLAQTQLEANNLYGIDNPTIESLQQAKLHGNVLVVASSDKAIYRQSVDYLLSQHCVFVDEFQGSSYSIANLSCN